MWIFEVLFYFLDRYIKLNIDNFEIVSLIFDKKRKK